MKNSGAPIVLRNPTHFLSEPVFTRADSTASVPKITMPKEMLKLMNDYKNLERSVEAEPVNTGKKYAN